MFVRGQRVYLLKENIGWRIVQFHWNPWIFRFGIVFSLPRRGIVREVNVFHSYRVVFPEIINGKVRFHSTGWRLRRS